MTKVLAFISLCFFKNKFAMIFASYGKSVVEIVGCFHCFGPVIVEEVAINKHYIFHSNNGPSIFVRKSIFFEHIQGCIFDGNTLFFVEIAKLDK